MKGNILEKLRGQHKELVNLLGSINENVDSSQIAFKLENFKQLLTEHLEIEDNLFYPDFFNKMKENNKDLTKSKEFYNKMKNIAVVVVEFLSKYDTASKIDKNKDTFFKELSDILSVLKLRIRREDHFIFLIWESLK